MQYLEDWSSALAGFNTALELDPGLTEAAIQRDAVLSTISQIHDYLASKGRAKAKRVAASVAALSPSKKFSPISALSPDTDNTGHILQCTVLLNVSNRGAAQFAIMECCCCFGFFLCSKKSRR